jgi:hypothetical protein
VENRMEVTKIHLKAITVLAILCGYLSRAIENRKEKRYSLSCVPCSIATTMGVIKCPWAEDRRGM